MGRSTDSGSHVDEWAGFVGCDVECEPSRVPTGASTNPAAGEDDPRDR